MCLTAKNFGLQEENINISKPRGRTTNLENGIGRERDRWTEREINREGGYSDL